MTDTIWKVVLAPLDVQDVEMPFGSEILCAREQYEQICVWFRCDPSMPKRTWKFAIVGTGHSYPDDGVYIGTASLHGGQLMFHVFAMPIGG